MYHSQRRLSWIRVLAVVGILIGAATAHAAPTLYVRSGGDDSADGLTPATALRTIAAAAHRLAETNGQVIVGPGTYTEGDISARDPSAKTVFGAPLEFLADRDGTHTGDAPGAVVVDAGGFATGFLVRGDQNVTINGFSVRNSAAAGIRVTYNDASGVASSNVTVSNCVIFSNLQNGIDVHGSSGVSIFNNLTYANGGNGIFVGDRHRGSDNVVIAQNTSYGNHFAGIMVGYGNRSPIGERHVLVLSNVLAVNYIGIKVARASRDGFSSGFNVINDSISPSQLADVTDRETDPLLVNPAGPDGVLGGGGYADDDFHLQPNSPAVDYGPADAAVLGVTGGTLEDGTPDTKTVDAGYHYANSSTQYNKPNLPGTPLFVRVNGDNRNDGSTPQLALRTIGTAAARARPGNTIVVGPGRYTEGQISVSWSGTFARPITFTADTSGARTGDPPGAVLVDAAGTEAGFVIQNHGYVVVDGFAVTNGADSGVLVKSRAHDVTVANCVTFSNWGHGILVQDARNVMVFNNLTYANGENGILLTAYATGTSHISVVNNTVYANGKRGIFIGANIHYPTSNVTAVNNIIARNIFDGIEVGASSKGVVEAFNLNSDGYAHGTVADVSDIHADPLFMNPAGADGLLGGSGFADDDFHLSAAAAGQLETSPGIDSGSALAAAFTLDQATVRSDGHLDEGRVDLGYHYGNKTTGPKSATISYRPPLYVAMAGLDTNSGAAPGQALRTITKATQLARKGNVIMVAPGTYREGDLTLASGVTIMAVRDALSPYWNAGPVVIDASGYSAAFRIARRSELVIDGFVLTGGSAGGIYVKTASRNIVIRDNIVETSPGNGIYIQDSADVTVFNNLVYANAKDGIRVAGKTGLANIIVRSNTAYANGQEGIRAPRKQPNGKWADPRQITNNIIAANGRVSKFNGEFNLIADSIRSLGHNITHADPLFINPAGADGILGGSGFADDDFHLSQTAAGQARNSPAIDVGPLTAQAVGLDKLSTRSDGVPDRALVDLGYHYLATAPLPFFVSAAGADNNNGWSVGTALRTIGASLRQAGAGSVVQLAPGTYAESGLHPGAGVTIMGPDDGSAVVDAGGNSTGFTIRNSGVSIVNVAVTGASSAAVRVSADGFVLMNCRMFANPGKGVFVSAGRDALIFNNLIYGNGSSGIVVGSSSSHAGGATIAQNTLVDNGSRGVAVGVAGICCDSSVGTNCESGPHVCSSDANCTTAGYAFCAPANIPSTHASIVNNIITGNKLGVEIGVGSSDGLVLSHNCNSDRYKGVAQPATDIAADPMLVGPLETPEPVDDWFYLSQTEAGQVATSPCVDAGFGSVGQVGLEATSTRTDGGVDLGVVDIGYHNGLPQLSAANLAQFFRCTDGCNE